MADKRFLQKGFDKQLAHVVEECGEVLAAAGKTQRWGPESFNPLLPEKEREMNIVWLSRELKDLKEAVIRLENTIFDEYFGIKQRVVASQAQSLSEDRK